MLKLLQEVDGHANFTTRRPPGRTPGLMLLPLRSFITRSTSYHKKRTLTVIMQDLPDIPAPVAIKHLRTFLPANPPRTS